MHRAFGPNLPCRRTVAKGLAYLQFTY